MRFLLFGNRGYFLFGTQGATQSSFAYAVMMERASLTVCSSMSDLLLGSRCGSSRSAAA